MDRWSAAVIREINLSLKEQQEGEGKEWEYRRALNALTPEERLKRYDFDLPLCCTKEDLIGWLAHNPKQTCICNDCTPEYREEMKALGKCNHQRYKKTKR